MRNRFCQVLQLPFLQSDIKTRLPGTVVKNPLANAGDARGTGLIPGLGRYPGEGNRNPLQYSCWEISWTEEPGGLHTAHWVTKSQIPLSD